MSDITLPTLLFWENGNTWYGSLGPIRFYITPVKGEEEPPALSVRVWRGPMAMEFSEITDTASFPLSEDGLGQLARWLERLAK